MRERPTIANAYGPCPCKGCNDRSAECHAICEKYQEYHKRAEEIRHLIKQAQIAERYQKNRIAKARNCQLMEKKRFDR